MITVEELKLQFGVRNIKDYGPCIVIPKGKFNIDWEQPLKEQNVDIEFNVDLPGGDNCTVLRLKPEHLGERVVYEPEKPKRKHKLVGPFIDPSLIWRPEEDEIIIARWNEGVKIADIAKAVHKKFPKRTAASVKNRIQRLQKAGKIQHRFVTKGKKTREKPLKDAGSEPAPSAASNTSNTSSTPARTSMHTPASTPKGQESEKISDLPELVKLMTEIRDQLKPKTFFFKYFCPECNQRGSSHDEEKVWRYCPTCGTPLIIWDVEAST